MPFTRLDTGAIGRSLAQIADRAGDVAEVYFERCEELELPEEGESAGLRLRREQGFAVRLVRGGLSWIGARDGFAPGELAGALRQVARAVPAAPYPEPRLEVAPWAAVPETAEVQEFPAAVSRAIRGRRVAFPFRLRVARHRRQLQIVGTRLVPGPQEERFFSCAVELPWARYGALLPELDAAAAERLAQELVELFEAREAPPPPPGRYPIVLDADAAAVLLHEAVAHALESDTLIVGGRPEAACGQPFGSALLNVLDDPGSAPEGVRRQTDDEGMPVERRWLLQQGTVRQPLADLFAARESSGLLPGAARRSGRHCPPVPRSTHLELLEGEGSLEELLAGAPGGLFFGTAARGRLDPLSGAFLLDFPRGRRISSGGLGEPVGRCRLAGRVAEVLQSVGAVGGVRHPAGAGWCAKDGQRLPVWATSPPLRIDEAEIVE